MSVSVFAAQPDPSDRAATTPPLEPLHPASATPISEHTARQGHIGPTAWNAQWIAHPEFLRAPHTTVWARHTLEIPGPVRSAWLTATGDDELTMFVNGRLLGNDRAWPQAISYDLAPLLRLGSNVLDFRLTNQTGPTGLLYQGRILGDDWQVPLASGTAARFASGSVSPTADHISDGSWVLPAELGSPPANPWGPLTVVAPAR